MIRFQKVVAGDRGVFRPGDEHDFGDRAYEARLVDAGAAEWVGKPTVEAAVAEPVAEKAAVTEKPKGRRRG